MQDPDSRSQAADGIAEVGDVDDRPAPLESMGLTQPVRVLNPINPAIPFYLSLGMDITDMKGTPPANLSTRKSTLPRPRSSEYYKVRRRRLNVLALPLALLLLSL